MIGHVIPRRYDDNKGKISFFPCNVRSCIKLTLNKTTSIISMPPRKAANPTPAIAALHADHVFPYTSVCDQVTIVKRVKHCGRTCTGILKFYTMVYTLNGGPQTAQRISMDGGTPSVLFWRQFCHICGMSWMHHRTVPIVPRTLASRGRECCGFRSSFVST